MEPIRPEEVRKPIPDEIIQSFNLMIKEKWDNYQSCFTLDEITTNMHVSREIVEEHILSIDRLYRDAGWNVMVKQFDHPETEFDTMFIFTKST